MIFRRLNKKPFSNTYKAQPNDFSQGFIYMVAAILAVFFMSFVVIIYFFEITFINLFDLSAKYLFLSFVSMVILFFYAHLKNKNFHFYVLPISLLSVSPFFLSVFLSVNFYFSSVYFSKTFYIPNDFTIEPNASSFTSRPKYDDDIVQIPNYKQFYFRKNEIDLSKKSIKIYINHGFFGYYVIHKKEYL